MNIILYLLVIISWVTIVGCSGVLGGGDAGPMNRDDSVGLTGSIPGLIPALSARVEVKSENGIFDK